MQDQPSALELVRAVREFLQNVAMPQLKDRAAFHARVAANGLAIVERELEGLPPKNEEELTRLRALLEREGGDLDELNRELCAKIRDGEFELDNPPFVEHLWETTLTKVSMDQPKYSAYRKYLEERGQ